MGMKNILPGLKTKITAWIMALGPVAALIGIEIDPVTVTAFVDDFSGWIASGYVLLGAAAHWFRDLADSP